MHYEEVQTIALIFTIAPKIESMRTDEQNCSVSSAVYYHNFLFMVAFFGPPGKNGNQIIPPHQRATDNREIAVHQRLELRSYPRMKGSHESILNSKI